MKKYLIILLLFLSVGCMKKDATFEDYLKKNEDINSYTIEAIIEEKSKEENLKYEINYKFNAKDNERELERIYKSNDKEIFSMYSFTTKEDSKFTTYFKLPNMGTDEVKYVKAAEQIKSFNILKDIILKELKDSKNPKKTSGEKDSNIIFQVEIMNLDIFDEAAGLKYEDGKALANIYIENSKITKITFERKTEEKTTTFTYNIKDINKTKLSSLKEIKNNTMQ